MLREEEEESMLEDAEDVGVKESVEEENEEDEYAKSRSKEKNVEDSGKQRIRHLMDELVGLSIQLKSINAQINEL
ncbi:hypothetical protein BEWA_032990 [Theileria equi strain WA]|uniref:Uncharacterized protein n=1 Tax=Theileria equi strain WA TaxID=1537102 RepID=L0AZM7_THEEQ|nr:hypothetical protein BEWA_032990 [Theileria equi strain WA]AFZ80446.1 hypothetical protein BEWA_032990 [Theileria equi strain WA]|eukprot:XP_004830112.1 hypothetical protein BEWA_032990 [Theileria equi strain WA]